MLIPQGTGKHTELNTSYTKFNQLLQELLKNRFSGYVKITFWGFEGIILFDTGRMIQAFSTEKEKYLTRESAVLRILERAEEADGGIEVHQLPEEVAVSLGFAIAATPGENSHNLKDNNIHELIEYIEKEEISGYMDLQFREKRGVGTIYFLEGVPVESIVMTSKGKTVSGKKVFDKMLGIENLIQSIEIHRVNHTSPIIKEETLIIPWIHDKYFAFWNECLHYLKDLMRKKTVKDKFFEIIHNNRDELKDEFVFLDTKLGKVQIDPDGFKVYDIILNQDFQKGMTMLLKKTFQHASSRRLRKTDFVEVISGIQTIARKYDVQNEQMNPEKFVFDIFDGLI